MTEIQKFLKLKGDLSKKKKERKVGRYARQESWPPPIVTFLFPCLEFISYPEEIQCSGEKTSEDMAP